MVVKAGVLTKRTPQTGAINDHCVPDVIDNQQLQKGPKIKNRNEKVIRDKLKIDLIRKGLTVLHFRTH